MKKLKLAIDVDLTVVDVLKPWVKWMGINHPEDFVRPAYMSLDGHYNVHFHNLYNVDPQQINDFWKQNDLYDNLEPMEGSIEAYQALKEKYDVYFLSICYSEHKDSKEAFLQRYFGEDIEMVDSMNCKSHYDFDLLIDDNPKVLMGVYNAKWTQASPRTKHLLQHNQITPADLKFLSQGKLNPAIKHVNSWDEVNFTVDRLITI